MNDDDTVKTENTRSKKPLIIKKNGNDQNRQG